MIQPLVTVTIYVLRFGGGKAKRMATGLGATFSPDGQKLVYFSDEASTAGYTLSIMEPREGNGGSLSVMGKDPSAASPSPAPMASRARSKSALAS